MKYICLKTLLISTLAAFSLSFTTAHPVNLQTPTMPTIPSIVLKGHTSAVTQLAWSPDSSVLASSAGSFTSDDSSVRLWQPDGQAPPPLFDHTQPVTALAWSPDGTTLASGSFDQTIKLWQADGGLLTIDSQSGIVFALAWSPDGKILASGSVASPQENTVQLWDNDGKLLHSMTTQFSGGKFYNLAWSPDGQYLVGGATDYAEWKADGTLVFSHESCAHCPPAWGFAWSPDSQRWVIGNESGLVWVYSVDGQQIAQLESQGNVDVMHWSPDGKWLAGGKNLWQVDGDKFTLKNYVKGEQTLAWSADGRYLASAGNDTVYLQQPDGKLIMTLTGHTAQVETLAWSPKGNLLASGSDDHTIRIWNVGNLGE
ncbi:MAG: hypothetical protein GC179_09670 [Anaerolineaceae bacterium]|nr:hypothetical protein [Anaerolineaceae bacterium]